MDPHTRMLHGKAILWWFGAGWLSISVIFFIGNIWITIQVLRTKKFISLMPLAAGILGTVGLGFMFPDRLVWCWIPMVVDWTVPMIVWCECSDYFANRKSNLAQ